MYKTCPFCKKQIVKSEEICPHCKRTLIERIGGFSNAPSKKANNSSFIKKISLFKDTIGQKFKKTLQSLKHFKLPRFPIDIKKSIIASVILFVLTSGLLSDRNTTPNSVDTSASIPQQVQIQNNPIYRSLPNGTIIHSLIVDSSALGQLKITNGTDYDALVKLVDEHSHLSVFTVFIKAKSVYTITHIKDGTYVLLFNTGNDWNEQNSTFLVNSSYSRFRDNFVFVTTESEMYNYIHTKYAVFEVTLNPVVGGNAQTDGISEAEFSKL